LPQSTPRILELKNRRFRGELGDPGGEKVFVLKLRDSVSLR
jgi:hypothetical protein